MKLLEENIGRTSFNIKQGKVFGDLSLKAKDIKAKINKWDISKPKILCKKREPWTKRRQATE